MNFQHGWELFLVAFFCVTSLVQAAESPGFGATLYFNDGTSTKFTRVVAAPGYGHGRDSLKVRLNGEEMRVPVSEIRAMNILNVDYQQGCSTSVPYGCIGYTFDFELRSGKSFVVYVNGLNMVDMQGRKINPLTGGTTVVRFKWVRSKQTGKFIRRVVFSEDAGNARINPRTHKVWPPSYNFDPETGEKLQWGDAE